MEERVHFIMHEGQQVLIIDLTDAGPDEIINVSNHTVGIVTAQPKGSLLLLADFTRARLNREAITRLKEVVTRDAPHIKRSAWVGVEHLGDVWYTAVKRFSTRSLPAFNTREDGLRWLTSADNKAAAS